MLLALISGTGLAELLVAYLVLFVVWYFLRSIFATWRWIIDLVIVVLALIVLIGFFFGGWGAPAVRVGYAP